MPLARAGRRASASIAETAPVRGDQAAGGGHVGAQPLEHREHVVVGQHGLGDRQRELAALAVQTLDG